MKSKQINRLSRFDAPAPATFSRACAPEFYLWGYLKEKVYRKKPQTILQLKNNVEAEILAIPVETLRAVMQHTTERAVLCENANGGHLRDEQWKKFNMIRSHLTPELKIVFGS
nr:unnamed protein product [Callosobruchus chinensis]